MKPSQGLSSSDLTCKYNISHCVDEKWAASGGGEFRRKLFRGAAADGDGSRITCFSCGRKKNLNFAKALLLLTSRA